MLVVVLLLQPLLLEGAALPVWEATWDGYIWGLPNGNLPSGPLLGNGDFGMTLQTNNHTGCFELWLGLNSMWGMPDKSENPINDTCGSSNTYRPSGCSKYGPAVWYPGLQSLGGIKLCVNDASWTAAAFSASQCFGDGVVSAAYTMPGQQGRIATRSFMHPTEKVLVSEVSFSGFRDATPPTLTVESWTKTLWLNATPAAAVESTRAGWDPQAQAQYFSRVAIPGNSVERKLKQLNVVVASQLVGTTASNHTLVYNHSAAQAAGLPDSAATIGARCVVRGGNFTMITIAKSNLDIGTNYSVDPLQPALAALQSVVPSIAESANQEYWKDYWGTASISLPTQPRIERFWFVANALLSSASRPAPKRFGGSANPNLWGPWITDDPKHIQSCGWCGAFVTDYNTEALLYGAFSSNKLPQLSSYVDLITAFLPAARTGAVATARLASQFNGRNQSLLQCVLDAPTAIHFPCGVGPFGMPSSGNGPSPGGDWELRTCGMFAAMPLLWQYEYFQNVTFGRETVLPILSGLAEFWRCWLQRQATADGDYIYVDNDDNMSEQGWWMGCSEERGAGCSRWQNPIISIAFLKRLFATLPQLSAELGVPPEPWWEEVRDHLPPYTAMTVQSCRKCPSGDYNNSKCPCSKADVFLMGSSAVDNKGDQIPPKRMFSSYYSNWPVFPSEHLDADSTGVDGATALSTASMFAIGPNSIGVQDFVPAIKMSAAQRKPLVPVEPGAQPVPMLQALNDWLRWTISEHRPWQPWAADAYRGNLFPFLTPVYVGGLEEIGVTMVINDMLLASTGNYSTRVLRLFPVWRGSGGGSASFSGLRAKGGFVVTASYDNSTDQVYNVSITSDAGRRCAVLSPWGHADVVVAHASTGQPVAFVWRSDSHAIFEFATVAGATYVVSDALAPPPPPPRGVRSKTDDPGLFTTQDATAIARPTSMSKANTGTMRNESTRSC